MNSSTSEFIYEFIVVKVPDESAAAASLSAMMMAATGLRIRLRVR